MKGLRRLRYSLQCDFANSNLKFYQFTEYGKRKLKDILYEIDTLVKLGYGSYKDLVELSVREIRDIKIVIKSKEQERALKESTSNG